MFFMVFAAHTIENRSPLTGAVQGPDEIVWTNPVGVFQASDAETACKKAAKKTKAMGNFFAVEGFAWGLALEDTGEVEEFGVDDIRVNKMERHTRELERSVGMSADGTFEDDDVS